MPFLVLLLLFFALELALFIEWGSAIGVALTLLEIVVAAVVGVQLIRWTGFSVLRELQGGMINQLWLQARQQTVMRRMLGGLLLIVPGFATDIMGLVFVVWSLTGPSSGGGPGGGGYRGAAPDSDVIDGDYEPADRSRDQLR